MKRNWKQVAGYAVFVAATISVVMAIRSGAPDRAAVVPDMKVLFENECVRVQYHDVAIGQTIPMHSHPNYIVYVLKPFKARITLPDGMQRISERKAGETYWNEAITRSVENIGSSDIHNLIIKLKTVKPFAVASMLLGLCSCMPDLCANAQIAEYVSPDGKLKAVTFRRDCGATTKETVQISILSAKKPLPNEAGNVFVAGGEPLVVVRWISDTHLSISGGGASGAFKADKSFQGVEITYD